MKKLFLSILLVAAAALTAQAQRLVIGEKAPAVQVSGWIGGRVPAVSGKPLLIDFFHSANRQCVDNLARLEALQSEYGLRLEVIAVARESADKVRPFLDGKGYGFCFGLDDGDRMFNAYGVRYVPFAALLDSRGRLVWTGNVAGLTDAVLEKALK